VSANESFRKALYELDAGDVVRGEQLLREVIGSREPNGEVLYYQACCCLGELLFELGRHDEAVPLLKQVATLDVADRFDDVLEYEIQTARRLLDT
jgi:hypothetical protein